jgi:hypothetical protein
MHSLKSEFYELFEKSKYLGEGILNLMDWLNKAQLYYRTHIPQIFKQRERKIDSETQNPQTIAQQSFGGF